METRINYQGGYLYCSVDCQVSNYRDIYDSSEECIEDIKDEILEDCKQREYNEYQTDAALRHYSIDFSNNW